MVARDIDSVVKCSLLLTVAANTGRKLQISEWQVPSPRTPRVETLHNYGARLGSAWAHRLIIDKIIKKASETKNVK